MKILVAGDGGMIYCKDAEIVQRAEEQLYLGLRNASGYSSDVQGKWWEFEVACYGRRAIMNDIASAIGLEQLKKLPKFVSLRKEIHEFYDSGLSDVDWLRIPPQIPSYAESSYYFYWIQMQPEIRNHLAKYLRDIGVYTTFRYYPLHWVEYYRSCTSLPNAEKAAETTLCIPLHQSLSKSDQQLVVSSIREFGKRL
jgi:dTDP-4-amino-4,6-dideoxygalactose transaminase